MNEKFFVHQNALCDSKEIGEGTRIWGFSQVLKGARIGKNCNICAHAFIENKVVIGNNCTIKNGVAVWDCVTLEDGVFVGPYAVFTNDLKPRAFLKRGGTHFLPTVLKRGCTLGANCTIVCGVTIGEFAMVGAGAVVTKDVAPHTLVVGSPARPVGMLCFCGERLDTNNFCRPCKKTLSENSMEKTIQLLSSGKVS